MKSCKCGSYAINIDPKQKECDVCYWKNKAARLDSQITDYVTTIYDFDAKMILYRNEINQLKKDKEYIVKALTKIMIDASLSLHHSYIGHELEKIIVENSPSDKQNYEGETK